MSAHSKASDTVETPLTYFLLCSIPHDTTVALPDIVAIHSILASPNWETLHA